MMKKQLQNYWTRYCPLQPEHETWIEEQVQVLPAVPAGTVLYEHGATRNYLYFVCEGLLAAAVWDDSGRRHLLRLLPKAFSILTTQNLYTDTQKRFSIVALRDSKVLRIPVAALRDYKECCAEANVLVHVLRERMYKQLSQLNELMSIKNEVARYARFCTDRRYRELLHLTKQEEQADYLNISINSIQRYRRGRR